MKGERSGQGAGLLDEQLKIVVKLGGDTEAPGEPIVGGDQLAAVADGDRPGTDLREHPQPDECDRDRVAILANGDHRLGVHPRRCLFGGGRRFKGKGAKERAL